ncbi:MAG: hypothetical protein GEU81_12210 [Nitriliruptorales bacterium]|nr:hypothetical protein [Nitriliruptorales bacterium]
MSRYLVDKFLYEVDRSEDLFNAYVADPASFVPYWEREHGPLVTPVEKVGGHSLTAEERRALTEFDFETLYRMGAHPFILWTLMLPILQQQMSSFSEISEHYVSRIAKYGRPGWDT